MSNPFKRLTLPGQIGIAVVAAVAFVGIYFCYNKYVPKKTKKSAIIAVNDLPPLKYDKGSSAPFHQLPDSNNPADISGTQIRAGLMGWNAQAGVLAANGGVMTMAGSIMAEQGVNLKLICQNDCNQQETQLLAFIGDYASGNKNSSKGYNMIAWMGDGCPSYLAGFNATITKQYGADYIAQVFYVAGSSFGEDKFIFADEGDVKVKQDPATALKGSLIVGVLRDGDWNIAMQYANMNQIPVNNDPTTYDKNAINWMGVDDYMKAAAQYNSKVKDHRKIVENGHTTGRDTDVTVNGAVTWFPSDMTAFSVRGGTTVASTKDFGAQMPCCFLASKKWLEDNRALVEKFILGAALGGDQVKSHSTWLTYASMVADKVYQDKTMKPSDWEKAFVGFTYTGAAGKMNTVGGSRVFNLADDAEYFGLSSGQDKYASVYAAFADLDMKSYPELFTKENAIPKYEDVVNTSYMIEVLSKNRNNANMTVASKPTFQQGDMTEKVTQGNYTIEFDVNSATIRPSSYVVLDEIARNFVVAENLKGEIIGHTDNTGNDAANIDLSQKRAQSVMQYLVSKNSSFNGRITSSGVGANDPLKNIDPNSKAGRQANRRVEIIMGR
jgi:OOP family OmpA-OmpF porin